MPESLHLVKVPLRPEKLASLARQRGFPLRTLDEGYLCHCLLRELWQERAPAPFALRGAGRTLDVWGYSSSDADTLVDHAQMYGDPSLLAAVADIQEVASKPMPRLDVGRRVGFRLRACPVARLATGTNDHRAGAEVDVFLARCFAAGPDVTTSREAVYRDWLGTKLNHSATTGVAIEAVRIAAFSRERFVRRTQGEARRSSVLERPDVRYEGELMVVDGERFHRLLAKGVGRHRAFGFGAMILVPPGAARNA